MGSVKKSRFPRSRLWGRTLAGLALSWREIGRAKICGEGRRLSESKTLIILLRFKGV